jgi:hypothetical protein
MSLLDYAICVTYVWLILSHSAWPYWRGPGATYAPFSGAAALFVMGVLLVYKFLILHGGCAAIAPALH